MRNIQLTGIFYGLFFLTGVNLNAIHFLSSAFEYKNSDGKKQYGIYLFWYPEKPVDEFKIFLNSEIEPVFSAKPEEQNIRGAVGTKAEKYLQFLNGTQAEKADILREKPGKDFSGELYKIIKKFDQKIMLLAIYDEELSKAAGLTFRYLVPPDRFSEKMRFTVKAFHTGKLVETRQGKWHTASETDQVQEPKNLKYQSVSGGILVSLNLPRPESGIIGFNVYLSETVDGKYHKKNDTLIAALDTATAKDKKSEKKIQYLLKELDKDKLYFLKAKSVHFNRTESGFSKSVKIIRKDVTIPDVPQISVITAENTVSAKIQWEKILTDGVSHYNIYRSDKADKNFKRISKIPIPAQTTEYTDPGPLFYKTTYWYRLTAVHKNGNESAMSTSVHYKPAKTVKPGNILIKAIIPGRAINTISFSALKDADLSHYTVYRSETLEGSYSLIGKINGKSERPEYRDRGLHANSEYCYKIKAVDKSGNFSEDSPPKCARPRNNAKVSPPVNVNAYADQGRIVVTWDVVSHPLLSAYAVYRKASNEKSFVRLTANGLPPGVHMYTDTLARNGIEYMYYVTCEATDGVSGDMSNIVSAKYTSVEAEPVQNLRIYKNEKLRGYNLSWQYQIKGTRFIVTITSLIGKNTKPVSIHSASETAFWKNPSPGKYKITVRGYLSNQKSSRPAIIHYEVR